MVVLQGNGNILIVDDEETLRWILNRRLSKEGYHCDEAGDGAQAIAKLKANQSELVLLDINMPGKQGTEVLPEIRASFPETAVVMSSGVTDTRVIAQCIKNGAQDYIRKPFSLDEVLLSVGMALEKRGLELQIREHQRRLERKVKEQAPETRKLFLNAIKALVHTLEANDKYTAGHSRGVTELALSIGKHLGLTPDKMDDLHWGALLHDVGKIAVDPYILNKPDKLTPDEYRHIMSHAIVGPNLVQPFVNDKVVEIILHHHDHYDGSGLDQVVSGEDIPLGARIVAAADAFDAMISDRPYREAISRDEALQEIAVCSGTQFDPVVASALLKIATKETPKVLEIMMEK